MADHPAVVHGVGRCSDLGMGLAAGNGRHGPIHYFIHRIPNKASPKSLGTLITVIINLRLGVMMGRIAAPAALVIDHFAVDHVGIRRIAVVKNGAHGTLDLVFQHAFAENIVTAILGAIEYGGESPIVGGALHQHFAIGDSFHRHLHAAADMEAIRAFLHEAAALSLLHLAVPMEGHLALHQQNGSFLVFIAKSSLFSSLHAVNGDIHHHIVLGIAGAGEDHHAVFKFRIGKFLAHMGFPLNTRFRKA